MQPAFDTYNNNVILFLVAALRVQYIERAQ